jgi:hypothetical protein
VLRLSNEAGASLGEAMTSASGRARFVVPSARLGPPGEGELRVVFAGTATVDASARSQVIERQTHVHVGTAHSSAGSLPPGAPEDGIAIDVAARAQCADHGCNAVPTGSVEMRVGSVLVAAAPLRHGAARLSTAFHVPSGGNMVLRLRYRPDVPWFQASDDVELLLPVVSPRPWGKLLTAVAGLGVLAWFVIPRLPSRKRHLAPKPRETEGIMTYAWPPIAPQDGWSGRVIDAHDGTPIAGARLRIERPGFQGSEVVIETQSIVDGIFSLNPVKARPGDQLVVTSSHYTPLRRPLPTFGHLEVAVVKRRHALLEGFVAWAKRKGGRFDAVPEPTPGHVRLAAGPGSPVAAWADALEKAIYGGSEIDAQAQSEIDRLSPDNREGGNGNGDGDGQPGQPLAHGRNSPG